MIKNKGDEQGGKKNDFQSKLKAGDQNENVTVAIQQDLTQYFNQFKDLMNTGASSELYGIFKQNFPEKMRFLHKTLVYGVE